MQLRKQLYLISLDTAISTRPTPPSRSPTPVTPKSKTRVPPPPPKPTALWVPPGRSVKVKDYVIPGGMVIKPNKRKLKLVYHPASSGFSGVTLTHLQGSIGDLPDVSGLSAPLNKLQTLIDDCTDALDPYSRWLGRNGEQPDSKAALALLPTELIDDLEDPYVRQLEQWLAQTLGENEQVVVPSQQLLEQWSAPSPGKLTKKESTTLAKAVENLGYGIELDVRFGGKPLKSDHSIVLFKLHDEIVAAPSKEYTAAMLLLHLAATVANSDAVIDAAEQQVLEAHLESALHLSTAEKIRLRAHLTWLLQAKLSLKGLKTKLNQMTTDERAGIADFLISVAGADGSISPQEIKMLTKIYPLLGFEADEVYSHIHTFNTVTSGITLAIISGIHTIMEDIL